MEVCAKWFSHAIKTERESLPETRGVISEIETGPSRLLEKSCHQHQSTGNSKIKSKQIVLFNCLSARDPQLLLSRLVNTCGLHGVHFHRALFVPSHSSFTQFRSSTTPDSPEADLSWQLFLQRTWENLIHGTESDPKIGPSFSQKLPSCEFLLGSSQEIYSSSAVFSSVPMTIKWLRECVQQNRSLHLEVLVTGSLHLIGDVLRMLKKWPCLTGGNVAKHSLIRTSATLKFNWQFGNQALAWIYSMSCIQRQVMECRKLLYNVLQAV